MKSELFVQRLAATLVDGYPDEFLDRVRQAKAPCIGRWDGAAIELMQASSPEALNAIRTLIQWVAMESVAAVLGAVDPASGVDEAGEVHLRDIDSGEVLLFLQSAFLAECEKRGLN
jgi:hypothetical protein